MKTRFTAIQLIFFLAVPRIGLAGESADQPGVVVEDAGQRALQQAGVQAGDLLLGWHQYLPPDKPAEGAIRTYFDWLEVENERAPRGAVEVRGRRRDSEMTFRIEPGLWDARVRPSLAIPQDEKERKGLDLLNAGQVEEANTVWTDLAAVLGSSGPPEADAWLGLKAAETWSAIGRHDLAAAALIRALASPRQPRVEAELLEDLADIQEQIQQFPVAEASYRRALGLRRALGEDRLLTAKSSNKLGFFLYRRGELARAREAFSNALSIEERWAPDSLRIAKTLNSLGVIATDQGDPTAAAGFHSRSCAITTRLAPDSRALIENLTNLGNVHSALGELPIAEAFFEKALALCQRSWPNDAAIGLILLNLGSTASKAGDLAKARNYLLRALDFANRTSGAVSQASAQAHVNLGVLESSDGRLEAAEAHLSTAIGALRRLAPRGLDLAHALNNLGILEASRSDLPRARELLTESLEIAQTHTPNGYLTLADLINLSSVEAEAGNLALAEQFALRALDIAEEEDLALAHSASVFNALAGIAWSSKDLRRAEAYLLRGRKMSPWLPEFPHGLGVVYFEMERFTDAEAMLSIALDLTTGAGIRGKKLARTLNMLGRTAAELGKADQADRLYSQSIAEVEWQVEVLGGTYGVQAGFERSVRDFYWDYLSFLISRSRLDEAFELSEKMRAQTFLRMLEERGSADAAALPELRHERRRLSADYDQTLEQLANLDPAKGADQLAKVREHLAGLERAAESLLASSRSSTPELAHRWKKHSSDISAVRAALDSGTLLLSYLVGADRTFVFAISAEAEPIVRILPIGQQALAGQIEKMRQLLEQDRGDTSLGALRQAQLDGASVELFQLLIQPFASEITASERLLILPDGPLHSLPFAALIGPEASGQRGRFLIERKALHLALSATVYTELCTTPTTTGGTTVEFGGFGDPACPPRNLTAREPVLPAAAERGPWDWQQLPFSRAEVEAIARLFPPGEAQVLLGAAAREETIKSSEWRPRILHIAAHAYIDQDFPMSTFLALASSLGDEDPSIAEDGRLQVWEIFESVRLSADLVVLSACETGLGKTLGGEGLIGLTRAFQFAGARTVVASLWKVADRSTADLMVHFYRRLVQGMRKDDALRAAQLELLRGRDGYARPYNWAAFQVYGDAGPVHTGSERP